jgi:heme oxygenase (biliverdin-IX-beta and delta-forming)
LQTALGGETIASDCTISNAFTNQGVVILAVLKERTRPLHAMVEREVNIFRRIATPEDYTRLLARFYGFYLPLDARLADAPGLSSLGIDFVRRSKAPLLRADLAVLGWSEAQVREIPLCTELPDLNTLSRALGTLYVVEGATLGGQIIGRQLSQNLDVTPERGGCFFASYGENVPAMWASFGVSVVAYANTADIESSIVQSACDTFSAFIRWFQEENHDPR